jgi:hypothetical protein
MPSDVSLDLAPARVSEDRPAGRRLPVGVGLTIGACASVALWTMIGLGLSSLFA